MWNAEETTRVPDVETGRWFFQSNPLSRREWDVRMTSPQMCPPPPSRWRRKRWRKRKGGWMTEVDDWDGWWLMTERRSSSQWKQRHPRRRKRGKAIENRRPPSKWRRARSANLSRKIIVDRNKFTVLSLPAEQKRYRRSSIFQDFLPSITDGGTNQRTDTTSFRVVAHD